MIHLELEGPHTRLCSTLCAACPFGPAGCCTAPPEHDWSDVGRVVALGGRAFLLEEIAAGNLRPVARGLAIRRVRRRESLLVARIQKCVYHGAEGCTIASSRRPATCNYFLCDEAYAEGGERRDDPAAVSARAAHGELTRLYRGWDDALAGEVRARWPEGAPWDEAFLDWLGAAYEALARDQEAPAIVIPRGMASATFEDLARFVRDHPVVDTDAALLRLFLVSTPRSPEHVLDLDAGGERVLVGSVLDTMISASAGALLLLLGFREREGSAEALGRALAAAEDLVRRGPLRRLDVPLPAALQRHAEVLSARGYAIAFAHHHMERPAEAPPPAPLPDGLRWVSASTADAEAMQAMSRAAFADVPGWYGAGVDAMRAMIAEAPIPPRLVREGDRLVAGVRVGIEPGGEDGLIHSIARDPAFRGRGLGVPLLSEAMRALHAAGARRFKLDVAAVNRRAVELYLRHGFVVTSEEPTYRKSLDTGAP